MIQAFFHCHSQGANFSSIGNGKGGVRDGAINLRTHNSHGHVPGSFVRNIGALDAKGCIQTLMRSMVGRVQTGATKVHFAGRRFGRSDELSDVFNRTAFRHHQNSGGVTKPKDVRQVDRFVINSNLNRPKTNVL